MGNLVFPESLYEQYRDPFVQRPPRHAYVNFSNSATNTVVATGSLAAPNIEIPFDSDAIFNILVCRSVPGTAQYLIRFVMTILNPGGQQFSWQVMGGDVPTVTAVEKVVLLQSINLEAGSKAWFAGVFNNPTNVNAIDVVGMYCLYPRMKF